MSEPDDRTEVDDESVDDSPLQSAVWLSQELGIAMPPVPAAYAEELWEIVLGRVFATSRPLTRLTGRDAIAEALAAGGWPAHGLAFGFVESGLGGRWFYTLVGEQQILNLSLRVSFLTEEHARVAVDTISTAHGYLEAYLSNETNLVAMVSGVASAQDLPRHVVTYDDETGPAVERHARWTAAEGTTDFVARSEIFRPQSAEIAATEAGAVLIRG